MWFCFVSVTKPWSGCQLENVTSQGMFDLNENSVELRRKTCMALASIRIVRYCFFNADAETDIKKHCGHVRAVTQWLSLQTNILYMSC